MPIITAQNQELPSVVTLAITPVDASGEDLADATEVGGSIAALSMRHTNISGTIAKGAYQRYRLRTGLSASYDNPNQSIAYDIVFTGTQKVM
jgi:hypothetical protein